MKMKVDSDFRSAVFYAAIVLSLACLGLFLYEVFCPGEGVKPWRDLSLNERGDFISGFFSPLALIWARVAVILQQRALNLQRREMELQRQEAEEQTKTFKDEVKNLERSDFRGHMRNLERQLQRHAVMIREFSDGEFKRDGLIDYDERDVELAIHALKSIDKEFVGGISENKQLSRIKNLVDRLCSYASRFDRLSERAASCGLQDDYSYYRRYTPYGHLLTACRNKLKFLSNHGVDSGYYWEFDNKRRLWVNKSEGKIGSDGIRREAPIVERVSK